jgi:subtilisin-like proprotein convertase family protein
VPVTVTVATSNITATAGSDYTAVNTALTFNPPAIINTVAVPIINDTAFEGNETFRLTLSNPLSATLGITTTAVITIFDNDPRPGCTIFNSTDVPKPIPDDKATGVDSVLVIPGPGVIITDTSVRIDQLMHTFVGDLNITLVAPDGTTTLRIVNQISGAQADKDNFIHTILNDSYPTPIANGLAPFTGNFSPYNSLSFLDGLASGGTWKLNVSDNASGDIGALNAWGLEICGSGVAPTYHVYLPLILR